MIVVTYNSLGARWPVIHRIMYSETENKEKVDVICVQEAGSLDALTGHFVNLGARVETRDLGGYDTTTVTRVNLGIPATPRRVMSSESPLGWSAGLLSAERNHVAIHVEWTAAPGGNARCSLVTIWTDRTELPTWTVLEDIDLMATRRPWVRTGQVINAHVVSSHSAPQSACDNIAKLGPDKPLICFGDFNCSPRDLEAALRTNARCNGWTVVGPTGQTHRSGGCYDYGAFVGRGKLTAVGVCAFGGDAKSGSDHSPAVFHWY